MSEAWLAPNRRALAVAIVPAAAIMAVGVGAALASSAIPLQLAGWGVAALGAVTTLRLMAQLARPRIGFADGCAVFNLRNGAGVAVPVEVVEAFFLGQGAAHIPHLNAAGAETVNLIARLSQKAPEWAKVDVKPALGHWCDGYVTIRGAWCEPLSNDVVRRLNRRLRQAQQARAASEHMPPSSAEANA